MDHTKKLLPPLVSTAVGLIVVTNYCIITLISRPGASGTELVNMVWPIALPTSVAVILLMSMLYHMLQDVLAKLHYNQQELLTRVAHDPLTGVASREVLEERLDQAKLRHQRSGEKFALIMLDLDHFKRVNDVHGHQVGDELLKQAATRLKVQIRESDTLARFGGDEFLILQNGITKLADVKRLCSRICQALQVPFSLQGCVIRLPVSVGAVVANRDIHESFDYLRAADIALYDAKANGRNCYRFFSTELDARLKRRDQLETDLRHDLVSARGIAVRFQPQISARGEVTGVEALFRWTHRSLGKIQASEAIEVAEESDLIELIGEYVFRQAARFARSRPELSVAVNLSAVQFSRSERIAELYSKMALEERVDPHQIELEISEKALMGNGKACEAQMKGLRDAGFRLALDDFGTGYCSIGHLRRLHIDRLKLDRSIATSGNVEEDIAVVRAAVTLAHLFGLEVVAEGIDTQAQEAIALEAGCDALQGFRYAAAMEAGRVDLFMRDKLRTAA